ARAAGHRLPERATPLRPALLVLLIRTRDDEFSRAFRATVQHPPRGGAMKKIVPCLWFDTEGEAAAQLYTSVFPNSKILDVARYGEAGPRPAGTVMTVSFELNGQEFLALNGGPECTFSEAVSFQVMCEDQDEVDHFWSKLGEGGEHGPCGWLKDRYGLSWQIVPTPLGEPLGGSHPDPGTRATVELLGDSGAERARRARWAMLEMGRLEIAERERAADG